MEKQFVPPMPSMVAFYPAGYPLMPPEALPPRLHPLHTLPLESLGAQFYHEDLNQTMQPAQASQRRRRPLSGSEHIKHRRTRSGCYTCRQRRVKCDEAHPICERCRKGKRECTYPGNVTSSPIKPPGVGSKARQVPGSPSGSGSEDDEEEGDALPEPMDDDEDDDVFEEENRQSATSEQAKRSSSSIDPQGKRPRTTSRPRPSRDNSKQSALSGLTQSPRWAGLPTDVKFYLRFHHDHLSYHHYLMKYDGSNFFKTTFLEIALNDPSAALLYAVISFSAYHYSLTQSGEKIYPFLNYYNMSINFLQQSLSKKRHSVATLLTILQLATIEEFLGDWVNLFGHQKAALQLLTDLFTPNTIIQNDTSRKIAAWYIRLDLTSGFIAGAGTTLGREWYVACADIYKRQCRERPNDLGAKFEEFAASSRLLAMDATLLFAARTNGQMTEEQFEHRASQLAIAFEEFGHRVRTAFNEPSSFVKDFPNAPPPSEQDITDFRDPNFLYAGPLSAMNQVLLDYWGIELMFKYQLSATRQQTPSVELAMLALKQCKMFEAIQYSEQSDPGCVLACQASLGISSLFLPRDEKHTMWSRRKLALVEQLGYIFPATLRQRMSDAWQEDVTDWWLPNGEGYPDIIRAIRQFIECRATIPTDQSARLRDISGIFGSLNLEGQRNAGAGSDANPPWSGRGNLG